MLTAPQVDSVNRFDAADTVSPKPAKATARDGRLTIALPPKSVTVVALEVGK